MNEFDQLLTLDEVAVRLGCSKMHVHRLVKAGALAAIDISEPGRTRTRFRIAESALEQYIATSAWLEDTDATA